MLQEKARDDFIFAHYCFHLSPREPLEMPMFGKGSTIRGGFGNAFRRFVCIDLRLALCNRDHLGTHDSLCSLVGGVEVCSEPEGVIYLPPEEWQARVPPISGVTILTLSRFKNEPVRPVVGRHWWMAGGEDTELVPYLIKGRFMGTSRGKIYHKD